MSSCRLVRVFCKQETNQKVEALREELELKETVIEKKDTKLNTLLQDPFGVIKLLATQYFNLKRRIEEPSNVRTRQFEDQLEQLSEEQLKQLLEIKDFLLVNYGINIEQCYVNNSEDEEDFVKCCGNTYIANNKEDVEFTTMIENDTLTKEMVDEIIPKETVKVYSVSIEGYKTIGEEAFGLYNAAKLTTLVIGNSVETIGDYAFYYCKILKELVIGNSVKTIGDGAFFNCANLEELVIGNSVKTIGDGAFSICKRLKKLVIGNSVETIGNGAFSYCENLQELVIGNSVETIRDTAFYDCENLEELVIGNSVKIIGNGAFSYCKKLKNLVIPDSVKTIGIYAFADCYALKELVIPDSVKTIGNDAFNNGELNKVKISDETAKKLNPEWSSPGTVSSFYGSSKPVDFILPGSIE